MGKKKTPKMSKRKASHTATQGKVLALLKWETTPQNYKNQAHVASIRDPQWPNSLPCQQENARVHSIPDLESLETIALSNELNCSGIRVQLQSL